MPAPSKRALILESAARIVETAGAAHLTIDAVAAAASISKGGVLYHFSTKRSLLEGMLEHLIEQMAARNEAYRAARPDPGNAALIAHITEEYDQSLAERAMSRAILAAAAEDPELLIPARTVISQAFEEVGAGSETPELGWVLLLAAEGLRFLEMLKLLPLTTVERRRVHNHLLALAKAHSA